MLIPIQTEYFALEGVTELLETIDRVREAFNPFLDVEGIVLTMYDERTNLGRQVTDDIRHHLGDKVYETVIPRNVRLGEAPSFGKPVLAYDIKSRGAEAYLALAREFLTAEAAPREPPREGQAGPRPGPLGPAAGPATRTFHVEQLREVEIDRLVSGPFSAPPGLSRREPWRSSPPRSASRESSSRSSSSPRGDRFEIVAGERRWRAARQAGLERVPVVVRERATDRDLLEIALVENLQREDLNPLEAAAAYARLREEFHLTQEDVARRVGKDRATVANSLRLLKLPPAVREKRPRRRASRRATRGRSSRSRRRTTRSRSPRRSCGGRSRCGRRRSGSRRSPPAATRQARAPRRDPFTRDAEEKLSRRLGTRVRIVRRRRGGTIEIAFGSEEELIGLFERLARRRRIEPLNRHRGDSMKTRNDGATLNGFLDRGSHFKGELTFEETFRIDGRFEGKIRSGSELILGRLGGRRRGDRGRPALRQREAPGQRPGDRADRAPREGARLRDARDAAPEGRRGRASSRAPARWRRSRRCWSVVGLGAKE